MAQEDWRRQLLLQMYDQLFNDITRHITVVWQSIGVLVGAFAIFALAEKQIITVDIAATLILLISVWSLAHLYDASYWYNRNLAMIGNIERQFLVKEDLRQTHYYFGQHRPDNHMITHIRIQFALAVGIALIILIFHFLTRVVPGFSQPISGFDPLRALPYVLFVVGIAYLAKLRKNRNLSYKEFLMNSPGLEVDTTGIEYGPGHGFPPKPNTSG